MEQPEAVLHDDRDPRPVHPGGIGRRVPSSPGALTRAASIPDPERPGAGGQGEGAGRGTFRGKDREQVRGRRVGEVGPHLQHRRRRAGGRGDEHARREGVAHGERLTHGRHRLADAGQPEQLRPQEPRRRGIGPAWARPTRSAGIAAATWSRCEPSQVLA